MNAGLRCKHKCVCADACRKDVFPRRYWQLSERYPGNPAPKEARAHSVSQLAFTFPGLEGCTALKVRDPSLSDFVAPQTNIFRGVPTTRRKAESVHAVLRGAVLAFFAMDRLSGDRSVCSRCPSTASVRLKLGFQDPMPRASQARIEHPGQCPDARSNICTHNFPVCNGHLCVLVEQGSRARTRVGHEV